MSSILKTPYQFELCSNLWQYIDNSPSTLFLAKELLMSNILVVATYNHEMEVLQSILEPTGHELTPTNNWTGAMELLTTKTFDLVIFRMASVAPLLGAIQRQQSGIRSILLYDERPENHTANFALQWPVEAKKLLTCVATALRNLSM